MLLLYIHTIAPPKKLTLLPVAGALTGSHEFGALLPKNLTSLKGLNSIDLSPGPYQRCFEVSERQLAPE